MERAWTGNIEACYWIIEADTDTWVPAVSEIVIQLDAKTSDNVNVYVYRGNDRRNVTYALQLNATFPIGAPLRVPAGDNAIVVAQKTDRSAGYLQFSYKVTGRYYRWFEFVGLPHWVTVLFQIVFAIFLVIVICGPGVFLASCVCCCCFSTSILNCLRKYAQKKVWPKPPKKKVEKPKKQEHKPQQR